MSAEPQKEKERRQKEEALFEFAEMFKELENQIEELEGKRNALKEKMRVLLKKLEKNNLRNDRMEIKINYPKSFDTGLFLAEYSELYDKYTSIEKTIKEKVVVNKKDLKRFHPNEYSKCEIELTPKLTVQYF